MRRLKNEYKCKKLANRLVNLIVSRPPNTINKSAHYPLNKILKLLTSCNLLDFEARGLIGTVVRADLESKSGRMTHDGDTQLL